MKKSIKAKLKKDKNILFVKAKNPNFDVLEEKTLTGETRPPEPKRKQRLPIDRGRGNFANSWK